MTTSGPCLRRFAAGSPSLLSLVVFVISRSLASGRVARSDVLVTAAGPVRHMTRPKVAPPQMMSCVRFGVMRVLVDAPHPLQWNCLRSFCVVIVAVGAAAGAVAACAAAVCSADAVDVVACGSRFSSVAVQLATVCTLASFVESA